ncbi:TnsD family Tn7-like transposition protein [Pseudomonas putida]|uniref:TnsD family Tn7-like transposition protein n=1 Tax=Pseudomonas putida TaxID=303 RepID=UPI000CD3C091|nr:TnsD family Tn7-like transposition protein [Pseudomonas putida]
MDRTPFTALSCSRRWAIGFISQMTRKPRGYCHPLKHLTLIWWLFGRLETFIDAYQHHTIDLQKSDKDSYGQLVLAQDNDESSTIVEIKSVVPKPKKLFKDVKEKILKSVISGASKKEVCSLFGISISTVNRLLRLNPAHDLQLINNRFLRKCEKQRAAWCSIVNQMPSASTNTIKQLIPNVYSWLYRNDRSWLMLQTNSRPSGRSGNHVSVDWEARDEKLCELIEKVLATRSSDLKKLRKRELYQMVPNLFSSLEQKLHYPRARQLVSEVCH